MRFAMITIGTRGDVQPYVALGRGLQAAGHQVCLISTDNYQNFVRSHGLEFASIGGDTQAIFSAQTWVQAGDRAVPILNLMREARSSMRPYAAAALRRAYEACLAADAVCFTYSGGLLGYHIAEKTGQPCWPAYLQNFHRTPAFPSIYAPPWPLGSAYNSLSHLAVNQGLWQCLRPMLNAVRQEVLDLPPLGMAQPLEALWRRRHPHLLGYSAALLPRPAEWGDWAEITGFWFLDAPAGWQPPAALADFLRAGPPPVVIGFGSNPVPDAPAQTRLFLEALRLAGQRGLFVTGWSGLGLGPLPDYAFTVESAPYDWLLPQAAAVVHHGGAGTGAAALRAGVPSVTIPSLWDQPFWAHQLARVGGGTPPLPLRRLTAERLAAALRRAVSDPALRRQTAALGRQVCAEAGVARAVAALERFPARAIPAARRRSSLARRLRIAAPISGSSATP